jgi:Domain of Unknown Function (DUF1206)
MEREIGEKARELSESKAVEWGARLGYVSNGVLHLLLGWLALDLAWGSRTDDRRADQSGALATVADSTLGLVVLWVLAIGFTLLALWQVTEIVNGNRETSDRAKAAAKCLGYSALAFTGYSFAVGDRMNSRKQTQDFTRTLMDMPAGQVLVGAVGLVVLGIAAYHVHKGWKQRFLQDLVEHPGRWAVVAGRVGYIVKGIALSVVGVLFVIAAVQHRSKEASGLDGALRTLQDAPAGGAVLTVVALGIGLFGIYSFARARYARV